MPPSTTPEARKYNTTGLRPKRRARDQGYFAAWEDTAMKRRSFLPPSGDALAGATLAAPAIAQSMPEIRWRCRSSFPNTLDTLYGGVETMASEGRRRRGAPFGCTHAFQCRRSSTRDLRLLPGFPNIRGLPASGPDPGASNQKTSPGKVGGQASGATSKQIGQRTKRMETYEET
jgi:ribosomal protein L40E